MKKVCRCRNLSTTPGITKLTHLAPACITIMCAWTIAAAEPTERAVRATYPQVSETTCPVKIVSIPGKSGNEVTAVVRQPPGSGPFPAIVLLHGGLSPYPVERLKEESRSRPNYTRFLASGFVIVVPTFRSREENPQTRDALDDCLAVVDHVKKMPVVDPKSVAVLGGSGGGSLALELAGEADLCAIVAGEPASVLFTGLMVRGMSDRGPAFQDVMRNPQKYYTPELQARTRAKVKQIHCPVLIVHGDIHPLKIINQEIIVPELKAANKPVEYIEYAGQPHAFWWGAMDPAVGEKVFNDVMRFLKPNLPTQPVALDESLIQRVPAGRDSGEQAQRKGQALVSIENDALRVTLALKDASLMVTDKRIGLVWPQHVTPGFQVTAASVKQTPGKLSVEVTGRGGPYLLTLGLTPDRLHGFDLALDLPGRKYTALPLYPFPFAAPPGDWFYVQNTTGEGMLMPLAKPDEIKDLYQWNGGQPWWGLTDGKRSMSAQLDSFRSQAARAAVYAVPMRIHYDFFTDGGYQRLAKEYRHDFLRSNPGLEKLAERVQKRAAVASLKDGVYVYLWGDSPAEDLSLVREMKAAGVARGIAVFYGRHEVDRALFDGIKELGWVAGMYRMPTGNLFQVSRQRGWPADLLLGKAAPERFLASSNRAGWDRVCAKHLLPEWTEKARGLIHDYGTQLFYFDTTVVQLAPCLHPDHPSTIEENQEARRGIMRATRDLGMLVGSGEGNSPTWALPELDFFEGLMSIRTYIDTPLSVPGGDYARDLGDSEQEHVTLDETRRIPLYQLAFHDYVGGTWVWRDTNFQSARFAWKKELFNVLYGTMPMWHIDRKLWNLHKDDMLAGYRRIRSVRERIGFAEMTNHGWLAPDRSVQFTDWDSGDRVIVNFGDKPFSSGGDGPLPDRSFVIRKAK